MSVAAFFAALRVSFVPRISRGLAALKLNDQCHDYGPCYARLQQRTLHGAQHDVVDERGLARPADAGDGDIAAVADSKRVAHDIAGTGLSVTVEIGAKTWPGRAVVLSGDDREAVFAAVVKSSPNFGQYQARTTRVIPVVELLSVGEN